MFEITPSGPLDHEIKMWIGLYHGECTGARLLEEGEKFKVLAKGEKPSGGDMKEVEYVYTSDYLSWVKILKKELDPIRALLSGQAKLQGDMAKVMRATRAASELVNSTTMFETEFL